MDTEFYTQDGHGSGRTFHTWELRGLGGGRERPVTRGNQPVHVNLPDSRLALPNCSPPPRLTPQLPYTISLVTQHTFLNNK
jgi:hypothetical protein